MHDLFWLQHANEVLYKEFGCFKAEMESGPIAEDTISAFGRTVFRFIAGPYERFASRCIHGFMFHWHRPCGRRGRCHSCRKHLGRLEPRDGSFDQPMRRRIGSRGDNEVGRIRLHGSQPSHGEYGTYLFGSPRTGRWNESGDVHDQACRGSKGSGKKALCVLACFPRASGRSTLVEVLSPRRTESPPRFCVWRRVV